VTVSEIIDIALSQGDNVPESDAGYIDRRRRALTFLREVVSDIWWVRDWPWKKTEADVTILADDSRIAVPWNFDSLGNYGNIFRLVGGRQQYPPLELVPESVVMEYRSGEYRTSTPRIFALFGQDPDTDVDLIQTPVAATDVDLRVFFQRQPPRLLDYGDPDQPTFTLGAGALTSVALTASTSTATVTTATPHGLATFDSVIISGATEPEYNGTFRVIVTGVLTFTYVLTGLPSSPATGAPVVALNVAAGNRALNEVPQRFHLKVMLNGLKAKLRESKGDARWKKLEGDYQAGIMDMKKELVRFQGEIRQMPSFFGDRNGAY
jgi:hypothetical protein